MPRSLFHATLLVLSAAVSSAAQSSGSGSPAAQQDHPATAQPPAPAPVPPSPSSANARPPKKVWTNDNMTDAGGPVSVVGNSRNSSQNKPPAEKPVDPQLVARLRKDLEKLESQMAETNRQLALLKDFQQGEAVSTGARQLDKGVNRVPVDQQILALQEKKKQLQAKIDALLDDARKRGVVSAQLR